jgi:hypothetical protein
MNYANGKIYTIKNKNDTSLIYVGSTIQTLSIRFSQHKCNSKNQKSKLYDTVNNDWTDWYIELYELYPCDNKTKLFKREGEIIQEISTLNKCIAGRTDKEYKLDNKEIINEKAKQYKLNNKEIINEKAKQYRLDNKEKRKQYYLDNKEILKEKQKQYRLNKKII